MISFARTAGRLAKTDRLDALVIAHFCGCDPGVPRPDLRFRISSRAFSGTGSREMAGAGSGTIAQETAAL
jgi:hypothetical protein